MRLYYSANSPYVRKVVVTASELGLLDRIELVPTAVYAADTTISEVNPLGRIPALETDDGEVYMDSPLISEYLDATYGGSRLLPAAGTDRWRVLRLLALGDGLVDAAASRAIELRRRPEALRWPEWIERQRSIMTRVYDDLEGRAAEFAVDLDLGQIAVGCALGYIDLRFAEDDWRAGRPKLGAWFARIAARPSFRDTVPPG